MIYYKPYTKYYKQYNTKDCPVCGNEMRLQSNGWFHIGCKATPECTKYFYLEKTDTIKFNKYKKQLDTLIKLRISKDKKKIKLSNDIEKYQIKLCEELLSKPLNENEIKEIQKDIFKILDKKFGVKVMIKHFKSNGRSFMMYPTSIIKKPIVENLIIEKPKKPNNKKIYENNICWTKYDKCEDCYDD